MLTIQLRTAWIFKLKKYICGSELSTLPNKRLVGTVDTLHSIWSVYLFSLVTYEVNTISYEQSQAQCQRINLEAEWNKFIDLGYVSSGPMKKYNFRTNHSIIEAPPSNLNLRWTQSTFLEFCFDRATELPGNYRRLQKPEKHCLLSVALPSEVYRPSVFICGQWGHVGPMNSSLSSNICDQNVNFFTKILCWSEMKATRSPAETAKYVIKAKLVSSLRDTILANFGLFRRQKNGFGVVYNKFLLPFHNRHILSCKKMQKKISLHIHFKCAPEVKLSIHRKRKRYRACPVMERFSETQ